MNEPIAKATPLALTAPAPKVAARAEDKDVFREELSFAAQLASPATRIDRSTISDNNTSDKRDDNKSVDHVREDKPDRSSKENHDEDYRSPTTSDSTKEIDQKESKPSNSNDSEEANDIKSSEEEVVTTSENTSERDSSQETDELKETLLAVLESSEEFEEQFHELEELLELEASAEILADSEIQSLIATDPTAALQLIVDSLETNLDLKGLGTTASEDTVLEEAAILAAEEIAIEEGVGNQLKSESDTIEVVNDTTAEAAKDDAPTDVDENLLVTTQDTSQTSEQDKNGNKSKSDGSFDLAALAEESNEVEASEFTQAQAEIDAVELTPSVANNTSLSSDGETTPLPQDITAGNERSGAGQTNNLTSDRIEAASTNQKSESGPQVDPARFITRVAKAFETAQSRGGGPIEIRLSPPELGSLQVRLEVKEGVLTASLETENQAARNALLDNLPALRERLAEQQIRIEKFDVDVRDDSSRSDQQEQQADAQNNREGRKEGQNDSARLATSTTSEQTETNEQPTNATIHFPEDGINVVA